MILVRHVFDNDLKLGHPRDSQMAVLEKDPASTLLRPVNHRFSFLILSLTQRDHFCSLHHVRLLCKLFEVGDWIRTRTEHEDKRSTIRAISEAGSKVECWGLNKLLAHFLNDVVLDGVADLVRTNCLQDNHLLERI